jgi:hypothetical protein
MRPTGIEPVSAAPKAAALRRMNFGKSSRHYDRERYGVAGLTHKDVSGWMTPVVPFPLTYLLRR